MKRYLTIYDREKTYLYPNMMVAIPEKIAQEYSVVNIPDITCVIETDKTGLMFYTAPEPIQVLKSRYDVDQSLTDEEAVKVMEEVMNAPQPEPEPTAEDRIASALEYQNLLSL